jgi:hypothetical protein
MAKHNVTCGILQNAREYDSALQRKEMLTEAPTWMDTEDMMLREIDQSISLACSTYSSQRHRDRKENGGCGGLRVRG